jgi:oligo-1,6-glucosidase
MSDIRDIESKNIYRLAKKLHIPEKYRWSMIRRTGRDNARTPMQWNSGLNAGFSSGTPWLKVNGNYKAINASKQSEDRNSILTFYRKLIALRSDSDILRKGSFKALEIKRHVFAFERELSGRKLMVILNFGSNTQHVRYSGNVVISSCSGREGADFSGIIYPWEEVIVE